MNTNIHTMQILQLTFYYICFLTQLPIYPSIIFYVFQYKLRPQYTSLLNTSFSMHINNYHSIYKFLIFEYNLPTKKYTNLKCKVFNKCTHCVTQNPYQIESNIIIAESALVPLSQSTLHSKIINVLIYLPLQNGFVAQSRTAYKWNHTICVICVRLIFRKYNIFQIYRS